jgi:hypothetical protein
LLASTHPSNQPNHSMKRTNGASILYAHVRCCVLLCYLIINRATVLFLLWKDKKSTSVQSASYWSEINCEKEKDDPTVLDTVCRDFSEKTRGIFAPLPKKGEKVPSLVIHHIISPHPPTHQNELHDN